MLIEGSDKRKTASPVLRTKVKLLGLDYGNDKSLLSIMITNKKDKTI